MALIVTGSIGIDTVESPRGKAENVLGGSSIYFAAGASLFAPVRLVGAVGDDFPDEHRKTFEHFNIDLAGLEVRVGSKTFRWAGKYHDDVNIRDTVNVELNVLAEKLPVVPEAFRDSRFVFLANTHPGGQLELLGQFPDRQLVVADTMNLWIEHEKPLLLDLLRQVDGLVLNDEEAKMLSGKPNLIEAAAVIREMGPQFVVIKKGEHGAMIEHDDGRVTLPGYPTVDVVDPTGAGDSFAGGMMGFLAGVVASGHPTLDQLKQAMGYGTIVASYNIEAFSLDRMKQITRDDVDRRYEEYAAMLRLP